MAVCPASVPRVLEIASPTVGESAAPWWGLVSSEVRLQSRLLRIQASSWILPSAVKSHLRLCVSWLEPSVLLGSFLFCFVLLCLLRQVSQAGLRLTEILLPPHPKSWDDRCQAPHSASPRSSFVCLCLWHPLLKLIPHYCVMSFCMRG